MKKNENYISAKDASAILEVSEATIRNWVKTGVLKTEKSNLFEYSNIIELKKSIKNGETDRLKSRRNKKHVLNKVVPKKYCEDKKSIELVSDILGDMQGNVEPQDIVVILAEYSLKEYRLNKYYEEINCRIELNNMDLSDDFHVFVRSFLRGMEVEEILDSLIEKNRSLLLHEPIMLVDDFLGLLYQSLQLSSMKKKDGVYYTPSRVVHQMVIDSIEKDPNREFNILDPCCGSGNFLLTLLKNGYKYENLFGYEIDEISTFIARTNVFIMSGSKKESLLTICENISTRNSYKEILSTKKFDMCIGNPPWGSVISEENIMMISNHYSTSKYKSTESFGVFIELGTHLVRENGYLCYIVPESLFSVEVHRIIREYMMDNLSLTSVQFFGNCFEGVVAPAVSFLSKKNLGEFVENVVVKNSENEKFVIQKREVSSSSWNLKYDDEVSDLLSKLQKSSDCVNMNNSAEFALGVVTGDNKKHLEYCKTINNQPIAKGSDIFKFMVKKPATFIDYKPETFQQVAKNQLYFAEEKLIYRFISDTFVFAYDDTQLLSLNSANVVVPYIKNLDIKYICAILNSRLSHFIFKTQFDSIKILRNHIESIPIKMTSDDKMEEVIEYVEKLCEPLNEDLKVSLYDKLDDLIMDIYEMSEKEKKIIGKFYKGNIFLF